jgi:hypothetical protein
MKTPSFKATLLGKPPVVITWKKGQGFSGELADPLNARFEDSLQQTFRPAGDIAEEILLSTLPEAVISERVSEEVREMQEDAES